jgi:hypothetical protein
LARREWIAPRTGHFYIAGLRYAVFGIAQKIFSGVRANLPGKEAVALRIISVNNLNHLL